MFSHTKKRDMEQRDMFLETMQIALNWYAKTQDKKWLDYAKDFGAHSKRMKEKIETHDYTLADKLYSKLKIST